MRSTQRRALEAATVTDELGKLGRPATREFGLVVCDAPRPGAVATARLGSERAADIFDLFLVLAIAAHGTSGALAACCCPREREGI